MWSPIKIFDQLNEALTKRTEKIMNISNVYKHWTNNPLHFAKFNWICFCEVFSFHVMKRVGFEWYSHVCEMLRAQFSKNFSSLNFFFVESYEKTSTNPTEMRNIACSSIELFWTHFQWITQRCNLKMNECQESIVFVLFYCFSYATSFVFLFGIAIKKGKKYNFFYCFDKNGTEYVWAKEKEKEF